MLFASHVPLSLPALFDAEREELFTDKRATLVHMRAENCELHCYLVFSHSFSAYLSLGDSVAPK